MVYSLTDVKNYLLNLQDTICSRLESEESQEKFKEDSWTRAEGGGGRTRVLSGGKVFEKAGVSFSHVSGTTLPASATAHRPELVGQSWEALGVSLVIHPLNPYVPTSHANVRFFMTKPDHNTNTAATFWFGGGFDLTPYYGFTQDCVSWHRTAQEAVALVDPILYPTLKKNCDDYFFLKHRNEARGIGGLFFDDFNHLGFDRSFALMRSVGDHFIKAYQPIVAKRKNTPYTERERNFQLYRRGRYVEFNLVWDRGTLFGLQSSGRTESILMSLPPLVRWEYDFKAEPGSVEEKLVTDFLKPRDWLSLSQV